MSLFASMATAGGVAREGSSRRHVLLVEVRRLTELEASLRALDASLVLVASTPGAQTSTTRAEQEEWMAFYDNAALALTQRGWWLCEHGATWRLRMPTNHDDEQRDASYVEYTAPDEILEVCGLRQHAEFLRKEPDAPVHKLLNQAEVQPIARLKTSRRSCRLGLKDGALVASVAGKPQVLLEVTQLCFDVKPAEDQAVADLLFDKGADARSFLETLLVDFQWLGLREEGEVLACQKAVRAFCDRVFGTEVVVVSARAAFPEAVAYLRQLRPGHTRLLRRLGIPLTDTCS